MVEAFGKAWEQADNRSKVEGPLPAGSRREAGLQAAFEVYEREQLN